MDSSGIPVPIFAALGALLAALVTGFFSFLNMVSAKENKVSEFRLAWIDGMRDEVADYTCAVQELLRLEESRVSQGQSAVDSDWLESSRAAYNSAVTSLTKIQLRLNPNQLDKDSTSLEAQLMAAIRESRTHFNAADFENALKSCELIRLKAALLLKDTWNLVKLGENGYRRIRLYAQNVILIGFLFVFLTATALVTLGAKPVSPTPAQPLAQGEKKK